jgi:hypothetical protein
VITVTCKHCGVGVRETSDPNVPWVHEGSANSYCDVVRPADAVTLAGMPDRTEALPVEDVNNDVRLSPAGRGRCWLEWHYGTIAPLWHNEPDGATGWVGFHGAPTPNPNHLCDECIADWHDNYPHHDLPSFEDLT